MRVWLFQGAGKLKALTADESGGRLPIEHGPWTRMGSIVLDHGGEDETEAKSLIHQYSYCCFHDTDD